MAYQLMIATLNALGAKLKQDFQTIIDQFCKECEAHGDVKSSCFNELSSDEARTLYRQPTFKQKVSPKPATEMGRCWWKSSSNWGWKKKGKRSWKSSHGMSPYYGANRYNFDPWNIASTVDFVSSSIGGPSSSQAVASQIMSSLSRYDDDGDDEDEMGHDDLDDEICYGQLRGNIVGVQYYQGTVNNKEMVALEREPHNKYDRNAICVKNVAGVQVGHIKRELAKPMAHVVDNGLARVEGIVPFGAHNMYSMPVELTFWGKPENHQATLDKMKYHGYYLTGGAPVDTKSNNSSSQQSGVPSWSQPRRTYLTPAEVKDELDKLFETIEEEDKSSLKEPSEAIKTKLYPHQKQALHWMSHRENSNSLPPFWEEQGGMYFNNIMNFSAIERPKSVRGGILADDMGLGKTLEMICLIISNFEDGKPLAVPVPGNVRNARIAAAKFRPKTPIVKLEKNFRDDEMTNGGDAKPVLLNSASPMLPSLPKLPSLPDSEESSGGEESEPEICENEEEDCKVMMMKEDPEFKPKVVNSKENVSPKSSLANKRPRRQSRKPSRYTYSSEDELLEEILETPRKKARYSKSSTQNIPAKARGKGKAPVKRKAVVKRTKAKKEESLTEISQVTQAPTTLSSSVATTAMSAVATVTSSVTTATSSVSTIPTSVTTTDLTKSSSFPSVPPQQIPSSTEIVISSDVKKETEDELPELPDQTPKSVPTINLVSEDELPDIESEVTLPYSSPGTSKCGKSSGRTTSTGPRATLIVCPLSVLSNWLEQFEDHVHDSVHLEIYVYYGTNRVKDSSLLSKQDVVLTTYATLTADSKNKKGPLKDVNWLRIVLDEGHVIRNPNAQQTKAICALKAQRRWVLTGTPIQNSMKDLWSLVNFLQINPFTQKHWWNRTIERPVQRGDETGLKRVQHLMCNIAMRRTKTQKVNDKPLVELPERNVYIEHVRLSEEERSVYEAMQNEGKLIVSKYFQQGTLLHHYGQVLAILMRLRQLCCHPFLVRKAAEAVQETLDACAQSGGEVDDELRTKLIGTLIMVLSSGSDEECAICLDGLKVPVITHCAHVFCKPCIEKVIRNERPHPKCPLCRGEIETDKLLEVPPERLQEEQGEMGSAPDGDKWKSSAKVDALMTALVKLRTEEPAVKSLVVSQFTSLLTLLETPLRANGFRFSRLDGTMSEKQRRQAIQEFCDPTPGSPTIFLLSLKAGGVGINLVAASRVFLLDPAWNPASEDQCFDRCHRLGQTQNVTITKFIVEESVEERMVEIQEKKRGLMQGAFGKKQTAEQKRQARIQDIVTLMDL